VNLLTIILKEMKTWIITDTHFGHDNIKKYCGRPDDYNEKILENLKIIQDGDEIIHLGDFCFGKDVYWHKAFFEALPKVTSFLLMGNHDKKSMSWYKKHGWNEVFDSLEMPYQDRKITFSHKPIPNIQNINIHGHFHNHLDRLKRKEWKVEGEEERNREVLAGLNDNHKLLAIEYTDYKPVLLEDLTPNSRL